MKNPLRTAVNEKTLEVDIKVGQWVFYKVSKIFGLVTYVSGFRLEINWNTGTDMMYATNLKVYNLANADAFDGSIELLDNCIVCESPEEKLFVELKYN